MALEYVDHSNSVSDATLLADLTRVANTIGHSKITISDYTSYGNYNPSTIMRHWRDSKSPTKLTLYKNYMII